MAGGFTDKLLMEEGFFSICCRRQSWNQWAKATGRQFGTSSELPLTQGM